MKKLTNLVTDMLTIENNILESSIYINKCVYIVIFYHSWSFLFLFSWHQCIRVNKCSIFILSPSQLMVSHSNQKRLIQIACPLSETEVVPFCIVLTILIALLEMKLASCLWSSRLTQMAWLPRTKKKKLDEQHLLLDFYKPAILLCSLNALPSIILTTL